MTKHALITLAAISYLTLFTPVSARANECMTLWKERNEIFQSYGYCFGTQLGKGYFGNEGCFTKSPSLSGHDKKVVKQLRAKEAHLRCKAQLKSWSVAKLRAHDGANVQRSKQLTQSKPEAGQDSIAVEKNLSLLGFNPGVADGVFDQQTAAAINAFQIQYDLPTMNTLPPEQLILLEALANAKSPNRASEPDTGDTTRTQANDLVATSASRLQSQSGPVRNPNASHVQNSVLPDLKFRTLKGRAVVVEHPYGSEAGSEMDNWNWHVWMLVNLPVLVPQLLEMNDEFAVNYANLILSDLEKRDFQNNTGLNAEVFVPREQYDVLPTGKNASTSYATQILRKNLRRLSNHSSNFLKESLDEFTRDSFLSELRALLASKVAQIQPTIPLPILQIYGLTLGEYDFENHRFPIEFITAGNNNNARNPSYTHISSFAHAAFREARVSTFSDLQEFPLFLPIEPANAKALVEKLAQYRGDENRRMYLGAYGELKSVSGELNGSGNRNSLKIRFNTEISHLEVSVDPEFNEIIHTIVPEKVTAADTDAMASLATGRTTHLYGLEYLVGSLSDRFPDMAQSNDLLQTMLNHRINLEQANLKHYGLAPNQIQRFVRDEVRQGLRQPNSDDLQKYRAYLSGLRGGKPGDTIIVPTSAWVRAPNDSGKTIEPGQPLDLLSRGLAGVTKSFGRKLSDNYNHLSLIRGGRMAAEPGTILMSAGSIPSNKERERSIPVIFSVRVGKSQANAPLTLAKPLRTDAHNGFSGGSTPFSGARYDWEIEGHIVLELTKAPELITLDGGRNDRAIVFSVTPQEIVLVDKDQELRFPMAEETSTQSALQPSVRTPDKVYFDAETADLLVARHMPDALTDAEIRRMLLARWHFENSFGNIDDTPAWGRFFEFGQDKPDQTSINSLVDAFRKWTLARAASLPEEFHLNLPHLNLAQKGLAKFGPTLINPNIPSIYLQSCRSRIRTFQIGKHGVDHQVEMIRNACNYIEQAIALPQSTLYLGRLDNLFPEPRNRNIASIEYNGMSRFGTVGPRASCQRRHPVGRDNYCLGMQKEIVSERFIGDEFVLDDVLVLDKYVSVPETVTRSENRKNADTRITFRVKDIIRSNDLIEPPFKVAATNVDKFLVEQNIRDTASINDLEKPFPPAVPMNLFQLELVSAEYFDQKSEEVFGALDLIENAPQPDPALLTPVKRKQIAPADAPYGADVVGLQLGMTFDEADQIIRSHMDVGLILIADRAWSSFEAFGDIQPYSSGRLYESEDEKEVIIIFDDAPSASNIIMGLTRHVVFDKGKVKPGQIIRSLVKKYGPPDQNQNSAQYWGEYNSSCAPSYSTFSNKSIWRNADGSETDWDMFKLGKTSGVATPGRTEANEVKYGDDCSHGLMATFDATTGPDWDHLTFRLFDKASYRTHFIQSKIMIEEGVPLSDAEDAGEDIDLKL